MHRATPILMPAVTMTVVRRISSTINDDVSAIAVAETLSCDEIVNRKFRHAEENGYIIEL